MCNAYKKNHLLKFNIKTGKRTKADNAYTRWSNNDFFPIYDSRGNYLGYLNDIEQFKDEP